MEDHRTSPGISDCRAKAEMQAGRLKMAIQALTRRRLVDILCALSIGVLTGCLSVGEETAVPEDQEARALFLALQCAWPKYAANSSSCYGAQGLSKFDGDCRKLLELYRQKGLELIWIYKLGDWFLLEGRNLNGERDRRPLPRRRYFKLGASADGSIVCREFDLDDGFWMNVAVYASPLRFAPIVKDSLIGFTEMWDSKTDGIVSVPAGFHGLIQGGGGIFLLRNDADGDYYRWDASNGTLPEKWNYRFPEGTNPRSSFFIVQSTVTGKRYVFADRLLPVPNSEGALGISPCGAYKGRQLFKFWTDRKTYYYAYPEVDASEPLSNGTETFDGCLVMVKGGKLVVVSGRDGTREPF